MVFVRDIPSTKSQKIREKAYEKDKPIPGKAPFDNEPERDYSIKPALKRINSIQKSKDDFDVFPHPSQIEVVEFTPKQFGSVFFETKSTCFKYRTALLILAKRHSKQTFR